MSEVMKVGREAVARVPLGVVVTADDGGQIAQGGDAVLPVGGGVEAAVGRLAHVTAGVGQGEDLRGGPRLVGVLVEEAVREILVVDVVGRAADQNHLETRNTSCLDDQMTHVDDWTVF